jgi:hypothetical protein
VEDWLFSRFIFYCFAVQPTWRDVSPLSSDINLTQHFAQLSETTLEIARFISENPVQFFLDAAHWQRLWSIFPLLKFYYMRPAILPCLLFIFFGSLTNSVERIR